jgi:hypothetical protein
MQVISLDQIRRIIDCHEPQAPRSVEPETAKLFAGITNTSHCSSQDISDALRCKVVGLFSSGHQQVSTQIKELLNDLIHEHVIHNTPLEPYYSTLRCMKDCMRSNTTEVEIKGSWEDSLKATVDYLKWDKNVEHYQDKHTFQAEFTLAHAMKRLRSIGKSGKLFSKPSELTEARLQEIFNVLERQVQYFGGIELAHRLFCWLGQYYDPKQMRYHYVTQLGLYKIWEPKIPIGLLINLAAKHPIGKKPYKQSNNDWKRLIQLSKDFACLYAVEQSNMYAGMFQTPISILPEMRRIALHDTLFSPLQLRATDVTRILKGLLEWFYKEEKISTENVQKLDSALTVLTAIQSVLKNTRGPVRFTSEIICKLCPNLAIDDVRKILVTIFSHPVAGANQKFSSITAVPDQSVSPELRAGADFINKPLLTTSKDHFIVLDHSICAPAMIEAILGFMRQLGITSELGFAVEHLLRTELRNIGIDVNTGQYQNDKKTLECDLVIENDANILFIETKAKALTRAGRAAFDISLLKDITDSLIHAIIQSGRHSIKILNDKTISLVTEAGESITIELRDRRLERLAITLHDFGGFQDRMIIDQILQNHVSIKYHAVDPKNDHEIVKVNKKLEELKNNYLELYKQAGSPQNPRMFFNCWFLSVPQFLILLDDVSDKVSLNRVLSRSRHITYGTNDFYYELKLARDLHSKNLNE